MRMLLLDSNSIFNRAFYGVRPLSNHEGVPTNAVYGFLNILLKLRDTYQPDYIAAAFDLRAPTFRHKMYDKYKAQRKGMPEELAAQLPYLKKLLESMNIKTAELEGYEADDIIGTLSHLACSSGLECIIATGDRDSLQLVDSCVSVALASTKGSESLTEVYTPEKVQEKYGLTPSQLIDMKALMGDSSDNVPGVGGIGEKTAIELIKAFGSIEELYGRIDSGTAEGIKPRQSEKLLADRDMAFLSKTLVTIDRSVPIGIGLEDIAVRPYNYEALGKLLEYLNFSSAMKRLGASPEAEKQSVSVREACADEICSAARKDGRLIFLADSQRLIFSTGSEALTMEAERLCELKAVLEDASIKKYTFGAKPFILSCMKEGINFTGLCYDGEIAAYLLNPEASAYDLQSIAANSLSKHFESTDGLAGIIYELCEKHMSELRETGMESLFTDIELPLVEVLASMEFYGFSVDLGAMELYGRRLDQCIETLSAGIFEMAGCEFNINSPKQLGEILFVRLGLPVIKKTKSGYSTDAAVLEKLRPHSEIIDMILEYRQLTKLRSTYVEGLMKVADKNGKVHSTFLQTVTQTGRISSVEPNLQNIPVKRELGRELRRMFIPSEGMSLCDGDYSQIELRVLAHLSGDSEMTDAFLHGDDIHTKTASEVFGVHPELVSPLMRSRAKAVNFGIVYGIGEYTLSEDLKISRKEAREYINGYLATYGGVKEYMEKAVGRAREEGFVTTLYGRRRYIPELRVSNKTVAAFGERVARNSPIQGTAADIIKIAMIRVYRRLRREKLDARLILQIHDELIVECAAGLEEKTAALMKEEMEAAAGLDIPVTADVSWGKSWYEAKE